MNWYIAKINFQIRIDGFSDSQFDIQQRLLSALDMETALQKAQALGRREETSFLNEKKENVDWKFVGVSELIALPELHDGIELFSSTVEAEDPEAFVHQIRRAEMSQQLAYSFQD